MSRYSVQRIAGSDLYGIYDHVEDRYCTLPDALPENPNDPAPNLLPLEWPNPRGAQEWLARCYDAWERGTVPAPEGWSETPDQTPEAPDETPTLSEARA